MKKLLITYEILNKKYFIIEKMESPFIDEKTRYVRNIPYYKANILEIVIIGNESQDITSLYKEENDQYIDSLVRKIFSDFNIEY